MAFLYCNKNIKSPFKMTLLKQRVNWTRVRPLTDMLVFNFFFMSAVESSLFIKIFYGISRYETDKSGDVLVKERNEKSLFHVDPFYSYSIPECPLSHFSRMQGILDKHWASVLSRSVMSDSLQLHGKGD